MHLPSYWFIFTIRLLLLTIWISLIIDDSGAFVASCFRGAFPPIDLRAVCFVGVMFWKSIILQKCRILCETYSSHNILDKVEFFTKSNTSSSNPTSSIYDELETLFESVMERDLPDLSRSIYPHEIFEPQPGNFGWMDGAPDYIIRNPGQNELFLWKADSRFFARTRPLHLSPERENRLFCSLTCQRGWQKNTKHVGFRGGSWAWIGHQCLRSKKGARRGGVWTRQELEYATFS